MTTATETMQAPKKKTSTASRDRLTCPHCGWADLKVVDSRWSDGRTGIRRRRRCQNLTCLKSFTTYELMGAEWDRIQEEMDRLRAELTTFATLVHKWKHREEGD